VAPVVVKSGHGLEVGIGKGNMQMEDERQAGEYRQQGPDHDHQQEAVAHLEFVLLVARRPP
jgi:hypothetical protein